MLVATSGRHPWRPAHVHFMIQAPGYETLITHVFSDGDPYLDSDVGVRRAQLADRRTSSSHAAGTAPDGRRIQAPFHTLDFDFVLEREPEAAKPLNVRKAAADA